MKVLLTGGAGFIGSATARTLVGAGHEVVVFDALTYAGRREHLDGVDCRLWVGDVCDLASVRAAMAGCDAVVHAAAESHVARSLVDAARFVRTNVDGTRVVLTAATDAGIERVVHLSTDEVFGAAPPGVSMGPHDPHRPGNPYAATKVAAEALVLAWRHSFGLPATIVRCTNNYGPRQHAEKAVPDWTLAALAGGPVPYHGNGAAVRDWLFVEDFARGLLAALERWQPSATWHFAGRCPLENREMALRIARRCGVDRLVSLPERQGQDARYDLDDTATREALGWAPQVSLDDGIERTVAWYRQAAR